MADSAMDILERAEKNEQEQAAEVEYIAYTLAAMPLLKRIRIYSAAGSIRKTLKKLNKLGVRDVSE